MFLALGLCGAASALVLSMQLPSFVFLANGEGGIQSLPVAAGILVVLGGPVLVGAKYFWRLLCLQQ